MNLPLLRITSFAGAVCFLSFYAFAPQAQAQAAMNLYPTNDGFELPSLNNSNPGLNFEYGNIPGYNITAASGDYGVTANGSYFNLNGATNGNHDGTTSALGQAAFLGGGINISQDIANFAAGTATVSVSLENRVNNGTGNVNPIEVMVDGTVVGTFAPTSSDNFTVFTSDAIAVTAGTHTVSFLGLADPETYETFVDDISVTNVGVVPEPSIGLLFGCLGLAGFTIYRVKDQTLSSQK